MTLKLYKINKIPKTMEYYQELFTELEKNKLNKAQLNNLKVKLCTKHKKKKIPTNIELFLNAPKHLQNSDLLKTKPVRTNSGVAIIALMTKPLPCPHGKCTYCPGGPDSYFGDVPQSYTGKEPATMRGIRAGYDSYLQVFNRLEQYIVLNQNPEKTDVIVMGGTFPSFSKEYQEEFIKYIYKAMNDFSKTFYEDGELNLNKFKEFFELPGDKNNKERIQRIQEKILNLKQTCTLEEAKLENETSNIRCIGLTIETKPDWGLLKHGNLMLEQGATKVELGVQTVYDKILRITHRGHDINHTIESVRTLKDLGFKLNYHYMPGSPTLEDNREKDIEGMKELFTNSNYKPDMLKIYPCLVFPGTELYKLWKLGKFNPINVEEAAERIVELKKTVPEYCRIMRVQRDIPTKYSSAGVERTNLRQYVAELAEKKGVKCRCIRCRQPKPGHKVKSFNIKIQEYEASEGKEFFIAAEEKDKLLGFCRLRFVSQSLRKEITKNSAIVRELHVYGTAVGINKEGKTQHRGIGSKLMQEAERICKENKKEKILVISGVGVREYYRNLGYKNDGPYVSKKFN